MGKASDSVYRFFLSARTTVAVIITLTILFGLGLVVPQKALIGSAAVYDGWKARNPVLSGVVEALRLNDIYTAPVTVISLGLFFLNLVVVAGRRVPVMLRKAYLGPNSNPRVEGESIKASADARTVVAMGGDASAATAQIRSFLKKRFWFPLGGLAERAFVAVRNRYSPLGFLFFHASFLLCLVGGLLVMYTRFAGALVLTEGQTFDADMEQFKTIMHNARIMRALPALRLRVDSVMPRYDRGVATDLDIRLLIIEGDQAEKAKVRINEPFRRGAVTLLAQKLGVSPLFVLEDKHGRTVDAGYVSLKVLNGEEDSFEFQGAPYRVFVRFYPDHVVEEGRDASRGSDLKNPAVHIRIVADKQPDYEGTLRLGETAALGDLRLSFRDVRYWVEFLFIREYGTLPLYVGFALGAIGLVMRLVFYQKTLKVFVEPGSGSCMIYLLGHTEHYGASFAEELRALVEDLQREIGRTADAAPPAAREA